MSEAMPDIDEQLAFHNERLHLSRPANPTPAQVATPLANTASPNTPLRMDIDPPAPVSSTTPRRHTHFAASENDAAENRGIGDHIMQQTPHSKEPGGGTNAGEILDRTNESRPMSRHGSKGANLGPPPPLGVPDSTAVDHMADDPQAAVSDSKAVVELKEEPQPTISDSKAVAEIKEDHRANERVASVKVHQEQLQQEAAQIEEDQREKLLPMKPGPPADAQPEEGEIESEEEGAL